MTRTPAQALADELREVDRQVIALGALGWHSKPDGSPEREMFRTKLELAGRISQQLRSMGMAPPEAEAGARSRVFVGERELRLHEEQARIVTEAINAVLAELHPVRWRSKRLRRRVAAALRRLTVNPKHAS